MNNIKSITLWVLIFLIGIILFFIVNDFKSPERINVTQFAEIAKKYGGSIVGQDRGNKIEGEYTDENGNKHVFKLGYQPRSGDEVTNIIRENKLNIEETPSSALWSNILISVIIPLIVIIGIWMVIFRQIQSGGNKAMSFGKARAKLVTDGQTKITFKDVAGCDEAKEELVEVIDFLKDPQKYQKLGGKIPKGILLIGPPGTGKTLLAKAVAGEASVPFLSISGSDFVEMFVGVGASRVRDLFDQAKKRKPCLIFVDEIDAVGRQRFAGIGGGHDEREQTLNQLLVEMDGFNTNEGVILIAATNRPDVLDAALLRPGRFDRQIMVDFPDVLGRERIFEVHSRKIPLDKDVNFRILSQATPGFSGADIANMVNEAALLAARRNKKTVTMMEFEEAKDRVLMGPERRSLVISDKERKNTAYHEAGHALVAKMTPESDPVHKVCIVPRGRSLGATYHLPKEELKTYSKNRLLNMIMNLMGGRAAEEIAFGEYTNGAGNDLHRATEITHKMVCEWGMSEALGPRTFGEPNAMPFLGRDMGRFKDYSEQTAALIDDEVKKITNECYQKAFDIVQTNREKLAAIAEALLERESLSGDEIDLILEGKSLPPLFDDDKNPRGDKKAEDKESQERPVKTIDTNTGKVDLGFTRT